ncbi:cell surface A33 antigen-like [Myripristis murdjan]|uniref:Glycoprotein A33 (transmembrane), paralog a n=1 Tax=Myripristis murdjan TaxID=586833 RepID=A0A667WSR8_9TELE|nr:cell surface A33 antigen-like [Myripristis murdjan]
MERTVFSLTLLCLVLSRAGALEVAIPQDVYEAARGDNITLPCSFIPGIAITPKTLVVVTWTAEAEAADAKESQVLVYYSTGITDVAPKYERRASADIDIAKGKANLKLNSITLQENKEFQCRVQIPRDDEGTLADTTRLVVLVAPSKPNCKIQGKAEYGQNINLTCVSEEGSPTPTYKWESRDVRDMPRVPDPRTTDKGGILSLYNISRETSGYYICTARNKIRSATCNITVTVMPPSMNIGSTAGIIGGVVAALIVLIIIIYCCCCRKKGDKDEEYTMAPVQEGEHLDKERARNGESLRDDRREDAHSDYDDSRSPADRRDRYEDRYESDHRSDYDDRRSDYDDRRSDYNDRRRDYDDRRSDYDDRRSDYDDRRNDYSDRRERYDDRHYDDERRDRRYDDERYDEPYDERDRDRPPSVPPNKPSRVDYDD